jgi:hypothetical protein
VKVIRYFHMNTRRYWNPSGLPHTRSKYAGATVRVEGDTDDPAQVDVQVTFCSIKDAYCRKTGREEALKAKTKVVMLRYLSRELLDIAKQANYGFPKQGDWDFAMKYFLPKE